MRSANLILDALALKSAILAGVPCPSGAAPTRNSRGRESGDLADQVCGTKRPIQ